MIRGLAQTTESTVVVIGLKTDRSGLGSLQSVSHTTMNGDRAAGHLGRRCLTVARMVAVVVVVLERVIQSMGRRR